MSILLEALRKSEEQRRLGQAPSIHSPSAGASEEPGGVRRWLVWALAAAALLAVVLIGWQQYRQPAATVAAAGQPAGVPASPGSGPVADRDKRGSPGRQPTRNPPSRQSAAVGQRTPVESLGVETDPESRARKAGPGQPETSSKPQTEIARSFAGYESAATEKPPAETVSSTGQEPAQPVGREQQEAAPPARPERSEPRVPEPVSYWELPQSVRDSLPDLRMTVLVFAEEPADRFVLIGGQRLRENEQYQDGLLLEEIRREGAVFRYRNYRFLVKG